MEWETDYGWSSDEWQIDNGYVMSWGSNNCHIITRGEEMGNALRQIVSALIDLR